MKRITFSTTINASREKVWETLWGEETYPQWTAPFAEGSKAVTNWNKGDKVLFLNAENEGMVSVIDQKKKPELMVFKHLGMIDKNGKEDMESDQVKAWAGGLEIYRLEEQHGKTNLVVEIDLDEEYSKYFTETWPKAFEKLKSLSQTKMHHG